jgi:NAD(P)H-hydrate epimerase
MKLLTATQIRELDRRTIEDYTVPGIVLMENAGRGAAEIVDHRYSHLKPGMVLVVAGRGNNGGDGYVMARHLENRGWQVQTLILAPRSVIQGDADINLRILENSNHELCYATNEDEVHDALSRSGDAVVVVDAIFGNGLNSEVRGHYCYAIAQLNALGLPIVAVDVPSGVDATTGAILGSAINADCSISFAVAKLGQVSYPAQRCGGELFVVDIGMPKAVQNEISDQYVLVDAQQACDLLPARAVDGHKGSYGHVLVAAGSVGKSGAAQMCTAACLRSGCGLATLATSAEVQAVVATAVPEIMTVAVAAELGSLSSAAGAELSVLWQDKSAVAIGPGLGQNEQIKQLLAEVLRRCPLPMVIDADGLNVLPEQLEVLRQRPAGMTVITPHPGEMARLTGLSIAHIQNNRCEVASQFSQQWQVVVVLKGAGSVVAAADGRTWINSTGNSGMASGGMGDVLTGVIAGWLSQGLDTFSAAVLGVYLHGQAADRCAVEHGSVGYLATDLLAQLPYVRQALIEKE